MAMNFERRLMIDGAYNIRDLGGYAGASGKTRWRRLLRSDGLHRIGAQGMATLYDAGLRTVIDLRRPAELAAFPNPFSDHKVVRYVHIPLFDKPAPLSGFTKGGGETVLLSRYIEAVATRSEAIRTTLQTIADAADGAVLFHCTAGKDRTGIIAALMLAIAEVPRETIIADYALTGDLIGPLVGDLIAAAEARGADIETFKRVLGSDPEVMQAWLTHIDDNYGDVTSYLKGIGLDDATLARLRTRIVDDCS